MKRLLIVLIICSVVIMATTGYSRIYSVNINDLYKLQYGNRFIPVLEELFVLPGVDYYSEAFDKDSVSVSVLVVSSKNYADLFLVTDYIDLRAP